MRVVIDILEQQYGSMTLPQSPSEYELKIEREKREKEIWDAWISEAETEASEKSDGNNQPQEPGLLSNLHTLNVQILLVGFALFVMGIFFLTLWALGDDSTMFFSLGRLLASLGAVILQLWFIGGFIAFFTGISK